MKKLFVFAITAFVLASCHKNDFETVPHLTLDSYGPKEVTKGEPFGITATVTDKEGDIKDSAVLVVRKVYLQTFIKTDTIRQKVNGLNFPNLKKFQVVVKFSYGELNESAIFQDYDGTEKNVTIGLIVQDNAGHRSNYVESDKILLKKL